MLDNFPNNFHRDDEEVFNEFRQKQVNFDLEERKNETDGSRGLFLGALGGLIMAAVVGWFVLAPRYQNMEPREVPVIAKPQMPVKVQPSEPADIEFASQERTVYDIIEKRQVNEENDNVVTSEEKPNVSALDKLENMPSSVVVNRQMKSESLVFSGGNNSIRAVLADNRPQKEENNPVEEVEDDVEEFSTEEIVVEDVAQKQEEVVEKLPVSDTVITIDTVRKAEEAAKNPEVKVVKEEKAPVIQSGAWQVQLMSSPNKAAAQKSWVEMSNKYDMLKNQPHDIAEADLGAKGIFYRLRVGAFANKSQADAFCSRLKAAGGNCFTAQK